MSVSGTEMKVSELSTSPCCWFPKCSFREPLKFFQAYTGLMLMLELQYFGHLMWRADLLLKTPIMEKIEGRRKRGWQRMRWLDDIINSMDMSLSKPQEIVTGVLRSMGSQRVGHNWVTEQQQGFTQGLLHARNSARAESALDLVFQVWFTQRPI